MDTRLVRRIGWLPVLVCAVGCSKGADRGAADAIPAQSPEHGDLVSVGYEALKTNDVSLVEPLIMTAERYRQAREEIRRSGVSGPDEGPSDEEIEGLAREAGGSLGQSFRWIQDFLGQLGFDWSKARLVETVVKKPTGPGESTRWIRYAPEDSRLRLDIVYLIESEGNLAVIKLNDALLVGGRRFLARGYYMRTYRPREGSDEKVIGLVMANNLNGWVPALDEE